jgi:hypothetical protein
MTARWYKWDGERFLWVGWVDLNPFNLDEGNNG